MFKPGFNTMLDNYFLKSFLLDLGSQCISWFLTPSLMCGSIATHGDTYQKKKKKPHIERYKSVGKQPQLTYLDFHNKLGK